MNIMLNLMCLVKALVAAAVALLCVQPTLADEVIMNNGDRLSGDLIRQSENLLKLKTDYAGTIEIDWTQVREVRLDEELEVLLDDEGVLKVGVVSREKDRVILQQDPSAQPIIVEASRLKVIEPEPWELGRGSKFNGRVNFALKDEKGNSESNEIDLDFTLDYRRWWHRFKSYGQLEYDSKRGIKTTDKWTLENNYNHLFSTPLVRLSLAVFQTRSFRGSALAVFARPGAGIPVH
jgi:hypothetical protein